MALKEIDLKGQSREQTEFEVRVMQRLKHKSLIRILDNFSQESKYYIVLEVAMGNNLIYIYIYIIYKYMFLSRNSRSIYKKSTN